MGSRRNLGCLDKREMLNRAASSADALVEWGKHHEEEELLSDAIDFYARGGAVGELERLVPRVMEDGDLFLLNRICRELKRSPSVAELTAVAESARELGKLRFADDAAALLARSDPEGAGKAR